MNREECIKILKRSVVAHQINLVDIETHYKSSEEQKQHVSKQLDLIDEAIKYLGENLK